MTPILATTKVAIKNVLLATDFSMSAEKALQAAVSLSKIFNAELKVANVLPPPAYLVENGVAISDAYSVLRKLSEDKIANLKQSRLLDGVRFKTILRDGEIAETICDLINEERIDVVVCGTHGAHGLEKVILGSVAEEIFRSVRCPVLTVGPKVKDASVRFDNLLFTTDFSVVSMRAAQYALSFAQENDSKITLLNVIKRLDSNDPNAIADVYEEGLANLQMFAGPEAALWCEPRLQVEFGEPAESILRVAKENDAHLIVMGVKHAPPTASHTLWSTASHVVQNASCPVLTVRDHIAD